MADQINTVDDYIAGCPVEVQAILRQIRRRIAKVAPGSGEKISYQMPTVTVDGRSLMYFAAWKKHVGIYPIPVLADGLEQQVAPYRSGRDSVRFPLREPVPYDLIEQVLAVLLQRRAENDRDQARS